MEARSLMLVLAACWEVVTRQCCVSRLPWQRRHPITFHCVSPLPPRHGPAWPQLSFCLSVQTLRHMAPLSAFTSAVVGGTKKCSCSVVVFLKSCMSQGNPSINWQRSNETSNKTWQLQSWFMGLIYVKWIESLQAFCLLQNYTSHLLTVLYQRWLSHSFSSNLQLPSISFTAVLWCVSLAQQVQTHVIRVVEKMQLLLVKQ